MPIWSTHKTVTKMGHSQELYQPGTLTRLVPPWSTQKTVAITEHAQDCRQHDMWSTKMTVANMEPSQDCCHPWTTLMTVASMEHSQRPLPSRSSRKTASMGAPAIPLPSWSTHKTVANMEHSQDRLPSWNTHNTAASMICLGDTLENCCQTWNTQKDCC